MDHETDIDKNYRRPLAALTVAAGVYVAGTGFVWGLADTYQSSVPAMYSQLTASGRVASVITLVAFAAFLAVVYFIASRGINSWSARHLGVAAATRRHVQAAGALMALGLVLLSYVFVSLAAGLIFYAPLEAARLAPSSFTGSLFDVVNVSIGGVCVIMATVLMIVVSVRMRSVEVAR